MQQRKITFRLASADDDGAVRQLFGELHAYNAALDERFALADGWEHILFEHLDHVRRTGYGMTMLAWEDAEPVGLIMMGVHSDSRLFRHRHWAELLAIYVAPAVRKTPVARHLLDSGKAWAHSQGYERVQLYVTASNQHARRFYEQAGFQVVQEIWRLELGPGTGEPPLDPAAEAAFAHYQELLTTGSSHLLIDHDRPPDTST
jgi:ribosomal protein S18 acetylase RimI-like enzyme